MTNTHRFGQIYVCRFPFTSGEFSKPRPVLVLFDADDDVVVCRVTSVMHSDETDVVIQDWRQAGLEKPSVARLARLLAVEKAILFRRIGELGDHDKTIVRDRWNAVMRL